MTAASYNFTCEQGAIFEVNMTSKEDDQVTPITNVGSTAKMQVRNAAGALIIELSTVNGRIVLGGKNGKIKLTISGDDTAALVPGSYVYDLKLTSGANQPVRILQGRFIVSAEVTQ